MDGLTLKQDHVCGSMTRLLGLRSSGFEKKMETNRSEIHRGGSCSISIRPSLGYTTYTLRIREISWNHRQPVSQRKIIPAGFIVDYWEKKNRLPFSGYAPKPQNRKHQETDSPPSRWFGPPNLLSINYIVLRTGHCIPKQFHQQWVKKHHLLRHLAARQLLKMLFFRKNCPLSSSKATIGYGCYGCYGCYGATVLPTRPRHQNFDYFDSRRHRGQSGAVKC